MRLSVTFTILFLAIALLAAQVQSQEQANPQDAQQSDTHPFQCSQSTSERNVLIREAETDKYTTRRVEFIGNRYTHDMVLRRKIIIGLQEGEMFTRRNLVRSLRNVSKLKMIYPVRPKDVVMHMNRDEKTVDLIICFKERRQSLDRKPFESAPANKALQLTAR